MASVNKVILIGNLGRDPEINYMPSGDAVANVALATTDKWKDKNSGEQKESTEWHRVVFYGKLAEIVGQYVKKGAQIYVEGRLKTRKWQDKDGNDKYTTEIVGDTMQILGNRSASNDGGANQDDAPAAPAANEGKAAGKPAGGKGGKRNNKPIDPDDIPF